MKKVYLFTVLVLFLAACTSSKKYLERGQYDLAIEKSVKKLMKRPDNKDQMGVLKRAYSMANQRNSDNISTLHLSGQPDIWESVFYNYDQMRNRQELVERLPKSVLSQIGHQHVDYNKMRAQAKNNAAKFFYEHAQVLLKNNNRQDARKAYDQLVRLQNFYPNYPNVRALKDEAILIGTNNVLFKIQNHTRLVMPKDFENELKKITLRRLNQLWLNFDTRASDALYYDYSIFLNLKNIDVSPELVKEVNYQEKLRVRDGDKYVLDQNGNVQKDSLGNDIKVPNYTNVVAFVKEIRLEKSALVQGTVDFYDNRNGQLIKTFPITTTNTFLHRFGSATGDMRALTKETKKILRLRAIPFPSDLQMIYDTNEDLKRLTLDIVRRNRNLLVN
jgi:tetratricopeptide (TPR) repeat protein